MRVGKRRLPTGEDRLLGTRDRTYHGSRQSTSKQEANPMSLLTVEGIYKDRKVELAEARNTWTRRLVCS